MTQIQDPRAREAIMRLADRHDYEVSQRLSRTITAARREVESVFALSPDASPQPKGETESPISGIPCSTCRGPCREFVVPSDVWNAVVRDGRPEGDGEYLCEACYRAEVVDFVRHALCLMDSPPPTDDRPQVKWGCKWTKMPSGGHYMLSLSGKYRLVCSCRPFGWKEVGTEIGGYIGMSESECIAALNACATPPPDFVDTIPSPPAETEWLPEGMKPPSLTSADDRNEVTEWTGQKYASAWREVIAARDSQWRAHCDRLTMERDEANQRHARVVEECDRLANELRMAQDSYNDLIMAVASKWPNETRHATALRYIQERENHTGGPAKENAALKAKGAGA